MTTGDALNLGREAFEGRAWRDAYAQLPAADREAPLAPEDLERLAMAAHLIGREIDSAEVWARAYQGFLDRDDAARAARCAFWLAFGLLIQQGERARSSGWLARARRLLDEVQHDCVEQGYLLMLAALQRRGEGDYAAAYARIRPGHRDRRALRRPGPDRVRPAQPGPGADLPRRNRSGRERCSTS